MSCVLGNFSFLSSCFLIIGFGLNTVAKNPRREVQLLPSPQEAHDVGFPIVSSDAFNRLVKWRPADPRIVSVLFPFVIKKQSVG